MTIRREARMGVDVWNRCPICEIECINTPKGLRLHISCKRCGQYSIDTYADDAFDYQIEQIFHNCDKQAAKRQRMIASSIIRERVDRGEDCVIEVSDVKHLCNASDILPTKKADRLLELLVDRCSYVGEELEVDFNDYELHAKCWILDSAELKGFIDDLKISGFIYQLNGIKIKIMPDGWRRIEELQKIATKKSLSDDKQRRPIGFRAQFVESNYL